MTIEIDEVCALLKCSRPTLMEELRTGGLPGLKFGQEWIIFREALLQRLNERALSEAEVRRQKPVAAPKVTKAPKGNRRPLCLIDHSRSGR